MATLILLQLLAGFRGVNRIVYASAPRLCRRPSIQPKHSAWSTDSDHVIVGRPAAFLWKPTSTSVSVA